MDKYRIHETVIRDIVDVISDVKKTDEVEIFLNKQKSFKSIANASSNLTLVFPVICSKNIAIDNMSIVAKAIERKAVSMLQILFSAISITDASDAFEYVKKFHTNLDLSSGISVDKFIDTMQNFEENGYIKVNDRETYEAIKEDMKNISVYLPNNISESSINDYKIISNRYDSNPMIIKEAKQSNSLISVLDKNKIIDSNKKNAEILKNRIIDSDIKKSNELIPTLMMINVISTQDENAIPATFVIGIKAKVYPVDSTDMMNRIIVKNQDGNGFLKFIKASTREISFFRDFMFAIDRAKIDALSQSKKGSSSKLWKVLERRAIKGRIRRNFSMVNDATSISTLVISQEEVEYLKKTENINLEDPKVMRSIMEAYGLMCACIIDDTNEVAKFIFDTNEDIYEQISFSLLEREASDSSYKKMINLISKMNK